MSLEVINTAATLGTFFVIAVTAVAATIQLRHARSSNQIAALNELRASQQTDHFIKALHCVYTELPLRILEPEFRYQLAHRNERTPQFNGVISSIEQLAIHTKALVCWRRPSSSIGTSSSTSILRWS
jgi:hypothetical protein